MKPFKRFLLSTIVLTDGHIFWSVLKRNCFIFPVECNMIQCMDLPTIQKKKDSFNLIMAIILRITLYTKDHCYNSPRNISKIYIIAGMGTVFIIIKTLKVKK